MTTMLQGFGGLLMTPVYYVVSFALVVLHWVFSLFLDPSGGAAWALSIVGMTILLMAAMTPLIVRQIRCWRRMTLGHAGEIHLSALYVPVLLQLVVFIALFRLLDHAAKFGRPMGVLSDQQAMAVGHAELFGVPISVAFIDTGGDRGVVALAGVLLLGTVLAAYLTRRRLRSRAAPGAPDGATAGQAQAQVLRYAMAAVLAVCAIAFPVGVLLCWTTSRLWTLGQQLLL